MDMLEAAEARDTESLAKLKLEASLVTPHQSKSLSRISTHDLTPPGAPKSGPEHTIEQARDFFDSCAKNTKAAALFASAEISKATKAAAASTKCAMEVATTAIFTRKPHAPLATSVKRPNACKKSAAPIPAAAKKTHTAASVRQLGQRQRRRQQQEQPRQSATRQPTMQLSPCARAAHEVKAIVKQAALRPQGDLRSKGNRKRACAGDPLARHGYAMQGPIAAGAFSTIVRAVAIDGGQQVAVKSFDNVKCRKDFQHMYLREGELAALRTIKKRGNSRWIANMIEEHVGPQHTYAILEYCAGGSLQRHLQKLTSKPRDRDGNHAAIAEADCAHMGAQINAALLHLHSIDVAHRDLKPGNVLFAGDKWLKLCDFGFAKRCKGQRLHTLCGTPIYMAPELTADRSKKGYKGHPVDMWAFGAMLYEMLHNKTAFQGVSEMQLHQRIRGGHHAPFRKDLSPGAAKVIKAMLRVDPEKRISSCEAPDQAWFAPLNCTARTARAQQPEHAERREYDA